MHLVETKWLSENLDSPNIKIIDATWHMPNMAKNAARDYAEAHILNALFFDTDKIADTSINLPHMLPKADFFSATMNKMGISHEHHIIIYDAYGFFSSARAWWTFKTMGHEKVSILNGGLKKWVAEWRKTTSTTTKIVSTKGYKAIINQAAVKNIDQMHTHLNNNDIQTLDARSAGRFSGKDPEPRAGLSSGHMPNGFNLPFTSLANADGTLKSQDQITALLAESGVDTQEPIVTTCGSGITAANLWFALDYIGAENLALYDGSWTEYAADADSVIVKG
ncbi:MAG: 3-mercaptopyruvate sulfurtransferase [Rhizobiales bacterium]|nr:3-mercaptopyruvate sulfurtransferase [Hyphomicrobiales bacterium]NRB14997.1 3-mercaptopyruvate sulfurtransferase [Hyphomicrobiales bacterium]